MECSEQILFRVSLLKDIVVPIQLQDLCTESGFFIHPYWRDSADPFFIGLLNFITGYTSLLKMALCVTSGLIREAEQEPIFPCDGSILFSSNNMSFRLQETQVIGD